jgi:uracil-DNA glycosylase
MNDWSDFLKEEFEKDYFKKLSEKLKEEYAHKVIYPPKELVFSAFSYAHYQDLKVVIVGQDPYHQVHQAHGLCFSVSKGIKIPPSLVNIYKELESDCGCPIPNHGNLVDWAQQGVLLLNASLTVEDSHPMSHKDIGWETFYEHVLKVCNDHSKSIVFILWGKHAQKAKAFINNPQHLIIESAHPSPLSAYNGFFGSKPFSRTNVFLEKNQRETIKWCIK